MKTLFSTIGFVAVLLLAPALAFGQSTLRGVVTDSTTNDKIIGANVIISGTSLGCATDIEGVFVVRGVPQTPAQVKISCIGYQTKLVNVDFAKNRTVQLNIRLEPAVIMGQEVVVTAQLRGQNAAINQQITSNTIVNVVSEEKIKELPDVNAAEAIGRLPGVSILRSGGEANRITLRGLSDRFSAITIDGVRIPSTDTSSRGVDLSIISQGSLAGIELFKALMPSMDGDAIAGSVNLVTRKAPEEREFIVDAKGSYNNLMKSAKQYDSQLRYGERFFNNRLGVQVRGNLERRIRSNEQSNINYTQQDSTYFISNFITTFTDEVRTRNGGALLLDFDTPDNGTIRANAIFGNTKRSYLTSQRNYPAGASTLLTYSYRDQDQTLSTFNSALRGENHLLGFDVTWGGSFAQSKLEFPFDYDIDFNETSQASPTNPDSLISGMRPPPILTSGPDQLIPYALNNFQLAFAQYAYYRSEKNLEKEKTGFADISRKYTLGNSISGDFKFGGKYKVRNRSKVSGQEFSPYFLGYWGEYTRNGDGTITPKNFAGTPFENYYQRFINSQNHTARVPSLSDFLDPNPGSRELMGKYLLTPLINRDAFRQWWEINKDGLYDSTGRRTEYYEDPSVDVDFYDITERIAAGYVMNTMNFGQDVTFIAGVRVEQENNTYYSKYTPTGLGGFPIPFGEIRDTSAVHKETILLPNFQVTMRPTDFINVRLAAYKALARPDYNLRLLKYVTQGGSQTGTTQNNSLTLGNPDLKTAKAWNFEVNTSFFSNTIGLITVSAFYKEIKDMFHVLTAAPDVVTLDSATGQKRSLADTLGVSGWPMPYSVGQQYALTMPYTSLKPTKVWGFEFEHQANFNFLPGFFKNFVLSYNVSVIRSETYLLTSDIVITDTVYIGPRHIPFLQYGSALRQTKQKLEGQPELYGNVALGYDVGGFSARVSLFFQGKFNNTFSATQTADVINDGYQRLDLALKQRIFENLDVMLNVTNLTNIEETTTNANRIYNRENPNTAQFYGLEADLGFRYTF